MTYSRPSSPRHAYFLYILLFSMAVVLFMPIEASAQLGGQPIGGAAGGTANTADTNPKTPFDTRDDYFKRFPFARSAFDHDEKTVYPWDTQTVEGPPTSFWSSFFNSPGQAIGGAVDGLLGNMGFGPIFGSGNNSNSNGNGEPVLRSQYSEPLNGAATPEPVLAYPPFIKFCNDNPYQGICYWQFGMAMDAPRTERDKELFENVLTTFGYPVSDTQFQVIQRENFQRMLELMYDPERYVWMSTNTAQMQAASASNSLAGVSESAFETMVQYVMEGHNGNGGLLNVANEASAAAPNIGSLYRSVANVYGVVMEMYKQVYVPMAILFLLPGAVITQVKATVARGFSLGDGNPFEGIIRSMVAVFLIPGTQVIVSYSIDVGNSMATTAEDWVDVNMVLEWQHELTYNVNPQDNHSNVIVPPTADHSAAQQAAQQGAGNGGIAGAIGSLSSGGFLGFLSWLAGQFIASVFGSGGEGMGANVPEADTTQEEQLALSQTMQFLFNGASYFGALMMIILTAMQIVMICYLFLLGPLTAAFFAWPEVGGSKKLFRNIFGSWLQGVIICSLWRFYWVLGLVLMTQRLEFLGSPRGTGDLQWEVATFICILGLMIWASMNPFNYNPADAWEGVESFKKGAEAMGQQGGGGQGGAGGAGGQSGGGTPGQSGGSSDSATASPSGSGATSSSGGDSSSSQSPPMDGASNDSVVPVADSSSDRGGALDTKGSGGDPVSADSGSAGDMANRSPEGVEAPPTDSGGSDAAKSAAAGDAASPPPGAGGGADFGSASASAQLDSSVMAAMAASFPDADAKSMSTDSAPVDMAPGDSDRSSGYVNPNASASEVGAAGGSTGSGSGSGDGSGSDAAGSGTASAQTGGTTGDGSGGADGTGSASVNVSVDGAPGDSGASGGQSDSPPPPNFNMPPPPSADSDKE